MATMDKLEKIEAPSWGRIAMRQRKVANVQVKGGGPVFSSKKGAESLFVLSKRVYINYLKIKPFQNT